MKLWSLRGREDDTFRSSSSTPGSRSISLTGKVELGEFLTFLIDLFALFYQEREEREQAGRKGRSFSFNRENSEEKEKKKFLSVPAVSSLSQLVSLDVSKNVLIDLPETIKQCKHLAVIQVKC